MGRRVVRVGAAALAAVVVLAGCTGDDGAGAGGADAEPTGGLGGQLASLVVASQALEGGGIANIGRGEVTVEASEAVVVLLPGGGFDEPVPGLSRRDRDELQASLQRAGFDEDDIELGADLFEPTIEVVVPVADLPERAEQVRDLVEEVVDEVAEEGVRFQVASCDEALAPAREQAVQRARESAAGWAAAAGVQLGPVRAVTEVPDPFSLSACPEETGGGSGTFDPFASFLDTGDLRPFDAEPEVELATSMSVVFGFDGSASGDGITAEGSGELTVPADRATIVVSAGEEAAFGFLGGLGGGIEEAEVLAALEPLGIAAEDVEVETGSIDSGSFPSVLVEVPAAEVGERGEQVVDALEEVLGDVGDEGVIFGSSRCRELLADAQAAAFDDARARIDRLAAAAGVSAGDVTRVADATAAAITGLGVSYGGGAGGIFDLTAGGAAPVDPCDVGPEALGSVVALFGGAPGPGLADFDDPAEAVLSVAVVVSAAVDGAS